MNKIVAILTLFILSHSTFAKDAPNVLWIVVDDMSGWLGCYGDETAATPNIDSLAINGVKFERAYMPSPVCSTSRSALITGTMQTSHGLHQHRTMIKKPLPEGISTIAQVFREAGYLTFNEQKTDYNFSYQYHDLFSPEFKRPSKKVVSSHLKGHDLTCLEQLKGKQFFGQIQLSGGKYQGEVGRKPSAYSRVKQSAIKVPPQYPDTAVMRNAIARHYEQIAFCDSQVGAIIKALKDYELWDNTIVFFFTDHGCPMPRAKQHLYDEGIKVPLIVHWPQGIRKLHELGKVRNDLVSGIDITTSSIDLAGLEVPEFMEGKKLFAKNYQPREFVISAKDRMGNAIDRVRSVRSEKFLYIKNHMTDRPLYQAAYRDGYATFVNLRKLYTEGKLSDLQASYHDASKRKVEELYDVINDPHQLHNLALNPEYASVLKKHRAQLVHWEQTTDDKGQQPPSKEELEKVYKNSKGKCVNPEYDFLK
ncbi:probable sulfatase [Lentisphaera araneosa HTCC2155]|uniref:Probable sulfatase n=1 Tax=Lentisphaera araneosa HTCC2155 TaxID=313628 RepID=A6DNH3_9BACT|nr:sulfatase [Lentisphaera araneosa]EDM26921.1 probable sulfatase [Lentisphaera araneosa HTCC2155]